MIYEFLNYKKYNINNIKDAFYENTLDDFFRICKMLKITINSHPGEHKHAQEVEELGIWLNEKVSKTEMLNWKQILKDSSIINKLYIDLYSDLAYIDANSIKSTYELSAFLLAVEYTLSACRNEMMGQMILNYKLGLNIETNDTINNINDCYRCYEELFDNISIEVKNVLEYIMYYKKSQQVCEKINSEDIKRSIPHIDLAIKRKYIDMITESWQFGSTQISINNNIVKVENDDLYQLMRLYFEVRERSLVITSLLAFEQFPLEDLSSDEMDLQLEINRTCFILQKQLYIDDCNCECNIKLKSGKELKVNILDLVKIYEYLKIMCIKHIKSRNINELNGEMDKECLKIPQKIIKKYLANQHVENPEIILSIFTYGREKDIIDAPLIACGKNYYLIPTLISKAQTSQIILSLASSFDFRGISLEQNIRNLLNEVYIPCCEIKQKIGKEIYQCDAVFILDNDMFLIEAKAWGFPGSITQYYQMNEKIIKAYNQLNRLHNFIESNQKYVLNKLGFDKNYKINNIYKVLLSNFQKVDDQELENTFICDFNSFNSFIKNIPRGIAVLENDKVSKIPNENIRKSKITSSEMVEFLKLNNLTKIMYDLLDENQECITINHLKIEKNLLKRNIGLLKLN